MSARYREGKFKAAKWLGRKTVDILPAAAGTAYLASKGGAAPLKGKNPDFKRRRRAARAKLQKCAKLKGFALKKEVCNLKNAVKELKHSEAASLAKLTFRQFDSGRVVAGESQQNGLFVVGMSNTNIETILENLKYFNPALPNTLTTVDAGSITYQSDFLFKSITSKLCCRNNYQTDVDIIVYACTPKKDTASNALTLWTSGIADDDGNVSAYTDYGSYPTDYETLTDVWSLKRVLHKSLSPGQSASCSHSVSNIEYDPAATDATTAFYQKSQGAFGFLIVVRGTVAHDTVNAAEQGIAASGIDYHQITTSKVVYDAGVNLTYVHQVDNANSASNAFVQSHQPVPDNIGYSQA